MWMSLAVTTNISSSSQRCSLAPARCCGTASRSSSSIVVSEEVALVALAQRANPRRRLWGQGSGLLAGPEPGVLTLLPCEKLLQWESDLNAHTCLRHWRLTAPHRLLLPSEKFCLRRNKFTIPKRLRWRAPQHSL